MFEAEFAELKLEEKDFLFFKETIFKKAGITMSGLKNNLIQARLRIRVQELGFKEFSEYRKFLESLSDDDSEWQCFINQLTTNKTDWFRENNHFTYLQNNFVPEWKKQNKKELKVWCAASSTGEEPYSLALTLSNCNVPFTIQATDIDTRVLEHAERGIYPREHLAMIPKEFHCCFDKGRGEISNWVRVNKKIKEKIQFRPYNLTHINEWNKEFDIIFCRNVLIYFNQSTIQKVSENLHQSACKDSVLVIAHAESLQNIPTKWNYKSPSIYTKGKIF